MRIVASLDKLDHLLGELGETGGQGKQGAGLAIFLPETEIISVVL